ncbi:hypothetical protein SARC_05516 [Sphaeroforma arctica JP610]|uniref:AAA+ ATPase domain-containing protein n=1 Tax=Sphaeroforma arctica JP610 TaxID=667725 RepID=A0A0L0G040_9EUKA|nr:hypothetical protein SARC_05516 [Sphaeroforma arctica JP610]KNC82196.1 hypothetical protein SARC_05516 [Sphaeroforma arctica JP610]|eukprot:XP_014156098.1 hypothetical protein SARC_05516 [Sphaeroforma arctica JP610]
MLSDQTNFFTFVDGSKSDATSPSQPSLELQPAESTACGENGTGAVELLEAKFKGVANDSDIGSDCTIVEPVKVESNPAVNGKAEIVDCELISSASEAISVDRPTTTAVTDETEITIPIAITPEESLPLEKECKDAHADIIVLDGSPVKPEARPKSEAPPPLSSVSKMIPLANSDIKGVSDSNTELTHRYKHDNVQSTPVVSTTTVPTITVPTPRVHLQGTQVPHIAASALPPQLRAYSRARTTITNVLLPQQPQTQDVQHHLNRQQQAQAHVQSSQIDTSLQKQPTARTVFHSHSAEPTPTQDVPSTPNETPDAQTTAQAQKRVNEDIQETKRPKKKIKKLTSKQLQKQQDDEKALLAATTRALKLNPALAAYYHLWGEVLKIEAKTVDERGLQNLRTKTPDTLLYDGFLVIGASATKFNSQLQFRFDDSRRVKFWPGDIVFVTRTDLAKHVRISKGTVERCSNGSIVASMMEEPADILNGKWNLYRLQSSTAEQRVKDAMNIFTSQSYDGPDWLRTLVVPTGIHMLSEGKQSPDPAFGVCLVKIPAKSSGTKGIPGVGSRQTSTSVAQSMKRVLKPAQVKIVNEIMNGTDGGARKMNISQRKAVMATLSSNFSLIDGPPGTGKTHTSVGLVRAWRRLYENEGPVLVVAQSHTAADQILTRLMDSGLRTSRIGFSAKVSVDVHSVMLETLMGEDPTINKIETERTKILRQLETTFELKQKTSLLNRLEVLKANEKKAINSILSGLDVVCCTCMGAGEKILHNIKFGLVVVDECTNSTEPDVLVTLTKARKDGQVVLIGDHRQLPPTVMTQDPKAMRILNLSLFERLRNLKTDPPAALPKVHAIAKEVALTMLGIQYRMHPAIAQWPATMFYPEGLHDGVLASQRLPVDGFPWPKYQSTGIKEQCELRNDKENVDQMTIGSVAPILVINIEGQEQTKGSSWYNDIEAQACSAIVNKLVANGMIPANIGVITPYTGQVANITEKIDTLGAKLQTVAATPGVLKNGHVEVQTVDSYQGREKEVIVLSCVRSSKNTGVGFLKDKRRMNVALTRAKRGLVVLADIKTLNRNVTWRTYLTWATANGLVKNWGDVEAAIW